MTDKNDIFDVIVIGGGHAGCEAYGAACRIGARTALVTPQLSEVGHQPCNPAVGGLGKGHLVREVVALGGLMGLAADRSGLQFRTLNIRKGPAVRATRVQTDSERYSACMQELISSIEGGVILEDRALGLEWEEAGGRRRVTGLHLQDGGFVRTRAVVVATGTFLRGKLYTGSQTTPGGRMGSAPAVRLATSLEEAGLPLMRLKTGTCPRLDGATINYDVLQPQPGDEPPPFFDPRTEEVAQKQLSCHVTYTGDRTHEVIADNLLSSAMYSGEIEGVGPRYCPSIETKIDRFPDKDKHQVFLEPEDSAGQVVYPSGLSTSLPREVQDDFIHGIPGLENAKIVRYGYAVEYDAVQPKGFNPTLQVDSFEGLFLGGQILGTSGYEEAAALGLVAGANAALWTRGEEPLNLRRDQSYAGVMIDDLVTLGVDEPYRMFTSRAEYRLLLREDNADERLLPEAERTGLLPHHRIAKVKEKIAAVKEALQRLNTESLNPSAADNAKLTELGLPTVAKPTRLSDFARRGGVDLEQLTPLAPWLGELAPAVFARLEVDVKYAGYLERQETQAARLRGLDNVKLPPLGEIGNIPGLRAEIIEKLKTSKPTTLGQASRIPGITPAAIQILDVWCQKGRVSS